MNRFRFFPKTAACLILAALFGTHLFSAGAGTPAEAAGFDFKATRPTPVVQSFKVYLSPSAQPWNPYCDGSGSEESHMRPIANAVSYYLYQYGIHSVIGAPHSGARSRQKTEIEERVKQAESNGCNLYLAIHSNAKDGGPKTNGTSIYYPSKSAPSLRFANILKDNFIYPDKSAVDTDTKDALWEMYMPPMPHCLIEVAYHDNPDDVQWIESNTNEIGKNLAHSIALYSYVPVSVSMDQGSMSVKAGKTRDLTAKVTLIDHEVSCNSSVWSSSNSSIAMVKNGTVYGVRKGTAVITARTSNYIMAKCTVTVQ